MQGTPKISEGGNNYETTNQAEEEIIDQVQHQMISFSEDQTLKIAKFKTELAKKQKELELIKERYSNLQSFLTKIETSSTPTIQEKRPTKPPSLSNKATQIQASLGAQLNEDLQLRTSVEGRIKIRVEEIADHRKEKLIGGWATKIAFKNPNSYLITSNEQGMKLVEENKTLFLGKLPKDPQWVRNVKEVIYVESLNCYFIQMPYKLFRKNIESKQATFDLLFDNIHPQIEYSKENGRLICLDVPKLTVINLRTKEVEFKIESKYNPYSIKKFRLFGKYRVVTVGTDAQDTVGSISLCKFNCEMRAGIFFRNAKFKLTDAEYPNSDYYDDFQVSDDNRYCFLSFNGKIDQSEYLSRIVIFDALRDKLTLKVNIDLRNERIFPNRSLQYAGHAEKCNFWLAISEKRKIKLFCYDTEKEEVKELEERRVDSGEYAVKRIDHIGDDFYYLGGNAKVMKLRIDK